MAWTYIPIILDQSILPDGEAAQILSIYSGFSPPTAVLPATNSVAKPYRKGRMRIALLTQWTDSTGPNDTIRLVLRSPFDNDDGDQTNRPLLTISPASLTAAAAQFYGQPDGGAPSGTPPVTAADYLATFNGKAIPNWTVQISATTGAVSVGAMYLHILWGHTTGN